MLTLDAWQDSQPIRAQAPRKPKGDYFVYFKGRQTFQSALLRLMRSLILISIAFTLFSQSVLAQSQCPSRLAGHFISKFTEDEALQRGFTKFPLEFTRTSGTHPSGYQKIVVKNYDELTKYLKVPPRQPGEKRILSTSAEADSAGLTFTTVVDGDRAYEVRNATGTALIFQYFFKRSKDQCWVLWKIIRDGTPEP